MRIIHGRSVLKFSSSLLSKKQHQLRRKMAEEMWQLRKEKRVKELFKIKGWRMDKGGMV